MNDELNTSGTDGQAGGTPNSGTPEGGAPDVKPGDQPGTTAEVEYKFEMPEGIEADASRLEAFTAIAKEAKLAPEVAQKVVAMEAQRIQAEAEAHATMVQGWAEQVSADPVLGVAENQGIAKGVIDKFGTPELRTYLTKSGLGNHPELVKFAYAVGKAMSEDKFIPAAHAGAEVDVAKKMFPTMKG